MASAIFKVFKGDNWSDLRPLFDDLVKDAEITVSAEKITIKGEKILFKPSFGRNDYGKMYEIIDEVVDGEKWDKARVVRFIKSHSFQKLDIPESDIKLFYDGFWNFVRRRRTYYVTPTPEIISKLSHIALGEIKEDQKKPGQYYTDATSLETDLTTPFEMETNNYRLQRL